MSASEVIYHAWADVISTSEFGSDKIGMDENPFPSFPVEDILDLISEAIPVFQALPNVLKLEGELYIVGDLHGNIRDLIRIFAAGGLPSDKRYLFLGDYVDRGDYSVEVISCLVAMALQFPQNVFLLRGNHEYEDVNSVYGFKDQVLCLFGSSKLFTRFQELFAQLPIAAVVNDKCFCVHGGLSPELRMVSDLDAVDRRAFPPAPVVNDIMWSDPVTPKTVVYLESERGKGCKFGHLAVKAFLKQNNLQRIIRAHEFTKDGVFTRFDFLLYSVFSTCNYKGEGSNSACILRVTRNSSEIEIFRLPLIKVLKREDASFIRRSRHERSCLSLLKMSSQTAFTKPIVQGANKFCKPIRQPIVRCTSATAHPRMPMSTKMVRNNKSLSLSQLSLHVNPSSLAPGLGADGNLGMNRYSSYVSLPMLPEIKEE